MHPATSPRTCASFLPVRAGTCKGVIGIRKQLQRCARAEFFAERFKLIRAPLVYRGYLLQKQHRDLDFKQMYGAVLRWPTGRMKRKAEECQSTYAV